MADDALRRDIFSQFYCPIEARSQVCADQGLCLFAHRRTLNIDLATVSPLIDLPQLPAQPPPLPTNQARPIPPYVCVDHLLGRCKSAMETGAEGAQISQCMNGLHPVLVELVDHEAFLNRMATALMMLTHSESAALPPGAPTVNATMNPSPSPAPSPTTDHQCGICLESIIGSGRYYGLLEQCSHLFCINCLVVWTNRNPTSGCPTCRQVSPRIQVWPFHVPSQADRRRIFDLEQLCADLSTTNRAGPATTTQRVVRTVSRQYLETRMQALFNEEGLQRASNSVTAFARRHQQQNGDALTRVNANIE